MTVGSEGVRKRRPQERAEITKNKLISVALSEFSERGFDAVTVRDIEVLAQVQRNLVSYHFGSKEELWKVAAASVFTKLEAFTEERVELVRDLSDHERLAYTIRSFVRFSARNPELNRLMIQEGKRKSWRIEWLVEQFLLPAMRRLKALVKTDLGISDDDFVHWYYLFVGGGAVMFSVAPEAQLLFDVDPSEDEFVAKHADKMVKLLLSRASSS